MDGERRHRLEVRRDLDGVAVLFAEDVMAQAVTPTPALDEWPLAWQAGQADVAATSQVLPPFLHAAVAVERFAPLGI
jgi:hypothetical protein